MNELGLMNLNRYSRYNGEWVIITRVAVRKPVELRPSESRPNVRTIAIYRDRDVMSGRYASVESSI